jgi:hypothetical protein
VASVIVASEFRRTPHVHDLLAEARKSGAQVIVVHTAEQDDAPGCVNVQDLRRSYPQWMNTGLAVAEPGPVLLLNDDLRMSADQMRLMLEFGQHADLVTLPWAGVTPLAGHCFVMDASRRFDEAYTWFYSDSDIWETAVHEQWRIIVGGSARHERGTNPRYPQEFRDAAIRDRRLFAKRWRGGNAAGLPPRDLPL